jgi:hypothetical protein
LRALLTVPLAWPTAHPTSTDARIGFGRLALVLQTKVFRGLILGFSSKAAFLTTPSDGCCESHHSICLFLFLWLFKKKKEEMWSFAHLVPIIFAVDHMHELHLYCLINEAIPFSESEIERCPVWSSRPTM